MNSRRQFFKAAGIAGGAIAASAVSRVAMAALPEPVLQNELFYLRSQMLKCYSCSALVGKSSE